MENGMPGILKVTYTLDVELEKRLRKDQRIKYLSDKISTSYKMQSSEAKLQILRQEIEEERLMNLQYQCANKTFSIKNLELKNELDKLQNSHKELTLKLSQLERKRKSNDDENNSPKRSSVNNVSSSDKVPIPHKLEEIHEKLRLEYNKLLASRDHYKSEFDRCLKSFNTIKTQHNELNKNYKDIIALKACELIKDPRLVSQIHKDKEKEINEITEKYKQLKKQNENLEQKLNLQQQNTKVDLDKVKKERSLDAVEIVEETTKKKEEGDQKLKDSVKILEDLLRKKEIELKSKDENEKKIILERDQSIEYCSKIFDKFKIEKKEKEVLGDHTAKVVEAPKVTVVTGPAVA